jgi:hypothetical protein
MDELKEPFYEDLQKVLDNTPKSDTIIILDDLNARMGKEDAYRGVTGQHTLHQNKSGNGKLLCEFAVLNNMTIMSMQFQHKLIHEGAWISSDEKTVNQIYYVMINSSKKELTEDVRSMRGLNIDSDHFLVKTIFNQKLPAVHKIKPTLTKKWNKLNLQDPAKLRQYKKILHEELSRVNKKQGINDDWNSIKTAITETASEVFQIPENQQGMNGGMMIVDKQFERRITPELKRCSPKQGQVKKST